MRGDAAFAVPRDRQSVTVRLDGGTAIEGEIFLEYMHADLSIHQKVTCSSKTITCFSPSRSMHRAEPTLSVKNVWAVEVGFPEDPETSFFSPLLMQAIPVIAHFCDGTTIRGILMAEGPKEKARLSDCLNMQNKFLSVKTDGGMCYIKKDALKKSSTRIGNGVLSKARLPRYTLNRNSMMSPSFTT